MPLEVADKNGDGMLAAIRKVLSFQMTIAEWIGTAVMLAIPYIAVGVVWASFPTEHLKGSDWADRIVLILELSRRGLPC